MNHKRKTGDSPILDADAVQMKCSQCEEKVQLHADGETQLSADGSHEQVQLHANGHTRAKSIQQVAAQGFSGSATRLPHLNQIQQSFGVNLSHVQAYIGGKAAAACNQMRAAAYASGNQIAFKEAPSVELAAHEAAHVVQQQSGKVQLAGGVGQVGDKYEQHADEVAARVGAGQSAGDLLAEYSDTNVTQKPVQAQVSEVVQRQVVAPPPVAPPPVTPVGPTTPNPAAVWVYPWLVIPGLLGNPWPTANDQIDPKTGRPRFPQEQPQIPPGIPLPKPRRYPNQTCDDERMAELEKEMHEICNKEGLTGFSCSDDTEKLGRKKEKLLTREQLLENIARARNCLKKRQGIQEECFKNSTDPRHEKPIKEVEKALNKCIEKYIARHGALP